MIALYRAPTPAARPSPPPPARGRTHDQGRTHGQGRTGAPLFVVTPELTKLLAQQATQPDDFSALVAASEANGQGWTAFHFAALYTIALQYVGIFRGAWLQKAALASFAPPEESLPDLAHIVVAWWWQSVANLEPSAFTQEGAAPFLRSAFQWFVRYGRELAPGVPSAIRWDLVPWDGTPWASINFAAYDWAVVKARVRALPQEALGDTSSVGTIDWRQVDWAGSIPQTTTPWSAVGWATIPWAAMPWDVVRMLAGWLGLLGLSPPVVTYAGPIAQLVGQQLTPTAQLLAQVAERVPGAVSLDAILALSPALDPGPPPPPAPVPPDWPIPPIGPGDWPWPLPGDKKDPPPPPPPPPPAVVAPPSQLPALLAFFALLVAVGALLAPAMGSSRSSRRRRVRARRRLPAAMTHRALVQAPPEVRARWNAQLASTPYTPIPHSSHGSQTHAAPSADLTRALADGRLAGPWGPAHEAVLRAMVAQNPTAARSVVRDVPLTGCPDGYEQVELFGRDGKPLDDYGCVNTKTGCLLGYEPDPANPGRCVFKGAGQPCGDKAGMEAGYKYDVNGNCIGPKGEVFTDACGKPDGASCPPAGTMPVATPPATPPPGELEGWKKYLTWKNAAIAAAALLALGVAGFGPLAGFAVGMAASSAGAGGGGGRTRRRVSRRRR